MYAQVQHVTISSAQSDQRIDNFLITKLKGVPKSHVYRLLRSGQVRVNGSRIKPSYRLQEGDDIRIPPVRVATRQAYAINDYWQRLFQRAILYEDDLIIAINKPTGVAVHGGDAVNVGVIEVMRALRPKCKSLELVHRLDKETSGCLLLAKKRSILKILHEQLREHEIDKRYLAIVQGRWPIDLEVIDAPLVKNVLRSGERIAQVNDQGKPSTTKFIVQQTFSKATLLEARPLTGRMHQIRVHAAHAGHPIAGDSKYGDKKFNQWLHTQGCQRLCLHASELRLHLQALSALLKITAPLPSEFSKVTNCL